MEGEHMEEHEVNAAWIFVQAQALRKPEEGRLEFIWLSLSAVGLWPEEEWLEDYFFEILEREGGLTQKARRVLSRALKGGTHVEDNR